ncbi:MAG: cytochrome c oxidase subunit II [Terriglobales bacterium]
MPYGSWVAFYLTGNFLQAPASFPVFTPHSPYARSISDLSNGVLWVMLGILVVVLALVSYCLHRFRGVPGQPTPKAIYGNTKLEVGYTISFFIILATILVFAVRSMRASDPPYSGEDSLLIVAHQWWWEVRYPGTGITTANEIHIPVGKEEQVTLKSADVIHDFWVPQLGRKMDIIPGIEQHVSFSADAPGNYYGSCAEFCGVEHAWMRILVIAQTPDDFARWEAEQESVPEITPTGLAGQGAQYFQQLSCPSCHTVRSTSATSRVGPDLTHVATRETLAAGRLTNTPENLGRWLHEPDVIKPGCKMPNLHLPKNQQDALVAYLETLR